MVWVSVVPADGAWSLVVFADVASNLPTQIRDRGKDPTLNQVAFDLREPDLDLLAVLLGIVVGMSEVKASITSFARSVFEMAAISPGSIGPSVGVTATAPLPMRIFMVWYS